MSEDYNHNVCLKTEVAVECAAGVAGFIFRNYDLNHIAAPDDIKKIEEKMLYYEHHLVPFRTEKELDEILAEIKKCEEYVRVHTPEPHR